MRTLLLVLLSACTVGEVGPAEPAPAAPSDLSVAAENGAHLTWRDNSLDEEHFMVMRMEMHTGKAGSYEPLATVDAGVTKYHDATIASGTMYMYMVTAMNVGGESDSNEVTFDAP